METFVAALGTVVAVFVLLRLERGEQSRRLEQVETALRSEITGSRTGLKGDIAGLRTELKGDIAELRKETHDGFASVNGRIDRVMEALLRHVQEGHPPHQAA